MMTKKGLEERNQVTFVSLDDRVPKEHLVRKIDATIDFNYIYDLV